jgi:acyl dehydratase
MPGGNGYLARLTALSPVYIGEEITTPQVSAYRADKRITTLKTEVFNQDGKLVLDGEAVVIAPKPSESQ